MWVRFSRIIKNNREKKEKREGKGKKRERDYPPLLGIRTTGTPRLNVPGGKRAFGRRLSDFLIGLFIIGAQPQMNVVRLLRSLRL